MDGESLEFSAKTVADAVKKAVQATGRAEGDLSITVVSEGRSGILGIGGEDAHIIVSVKAPPAPVAAANSPASNDEGDGERVRPRPVPITPELTEEARAILLDLLDLIGVDTDIETKERDGSLVLEVIGEDLGLLIGRRGDTLAALQFVLNLIVAKRQKRWARVVVDIEGYRARREETLSDLARRIAERVRATGQPVALEAMPAGERRVIHVALADDPGIATGSIGEGENRKVVISPKR